jgi:hypothetical protein
MSVDVEAAAEYLGRSKLATELEPRGLCHSAAYGKKPVIQAQRVGKEA